MYDSALSVQLWSVSCIALLHRYVCQLLEEVLFVCFIVVSCVSGPFRILHPWWILSQSHSHLSFVFLDHSTGPMRTTRECLQFQRVLTAALSTWFAQFQKVLILGTVCIVCTVSVSLHDLHGLQSFTESWHLFNLHEFRECWHPAWFPHLKINNYVYLYLPGLFQGKEIWDVANNWSHWTNLVSWYLVYVDILLLG